MSAPSTHPVQPAEGDPGIPPPDEDVNADDSRGAGDRATGRDVGAERAHIPENTEIDSGPLASGPALGPAGPSSALPDAGGGGGDGGRSSVIDWGLGVVRIGVGAALMAAPGWAGRIWVGPGADGPGSKVFARALGARDVALGVQILRGLSRKEPVGHWVMAGFVADAADVTASVVAARNMTPARRILVPAVAGAVGALGFTSWKAASPEAR